MTTFILKSCLNMKKYKTLTAVLIFVMWIITRIISTAKKNNKKQINVIESLLYYKVFPGADPGFQVRGGRT